MAETLSGLGDAGAVAVSSAASETGTRRLSDLRVIDLRAELRKRNLDSSGNKSVLMERLRKVRFAGDPSVAMATPTAGSAAARGLCTARFRSGSLGSGGRSSNPEAVAMRPEAIPV